MFPVFTSSTRFASGSSLPTAIASTGPSAFAQHSNTGAIVGAAVGGVLAFLLLIAVIFCVVFRRRRQTHTDTSVPDSSQTAPVREVSISETSDRPLKEEGGSIIGHTGFYVRGYDSVSWSEKPLTHHFSAILRTLMTHGHIPHRLRI